MRRKLLLFMLGSLAVLGLSLALIPDKSEIALMEWRDSNYTEAYRRYQQLQETGATSANVIIPLINLHLHYGRLEEAILQMEQYTREHPRSIEAQRQLVALYQAAQKPYAYTRALERLQELSPSEENLRLLADTYDFLDDQTARIHALERLFAARGYTPLEPDVTALAGLYANRQRLPEALEVLDRFIRKQGYQVQIDTLRSALHLALSQEKEEEAETLAADYVRHHPSALNAASLAEIFSLHGKNAPALALLTPYAERLEAIPALYQQYITLLIAQGMEEKAHDALKASLAEGTLPDSLAEPLLDFALKRRDFTEMEATIAALPARALPENAMWEYALAAYNQKEATLALRLKEKLAADAPAPLRALLDLAMEDSPQHFTALKEAISAAALNEQHKARIAAIFLQHGDYASADALIRHMPPTAVLEALGAWQAANYYLLQSTAEEVLDAYRQASGNKTAQEAVLYLLAGLGKIEPLRTALNSVERLPLPLVEAMQSLAAVHRQHPASLMLAQYLYAGDASAGHRLLLAQALLDSGRYAEAATHLRAIKNTSKGAQGLYITALAAMAKGSSGEHVSQALAEWLRQPEVSAEDKRRIAYMLIDAGERTQAVEVFRTLAEGKEFADNDVQELLYLWGEQPGPEALDWMETRAREMGPSQGEWLAYLNGLGAHARVTRTLAGQQDFSETAENAYLEALSRTKDKRALSAFLSRRLQATENVRAIKRYAQIAADESLDTLANQAWQRVYHLSPGEKEAARALGIYSYEHKQWKEAEKYLAEYLQGQEGDYLANYYYATLLNRSNDLNAEEYFSRALAQLPPDPGSDPQTAIIEAHLLEQLDRKQEAREVYKKLVLRYPENKSIKADYTNLLIELKELDEAALVLSNDNTIHSFTYEVTP